MVLKEKTTNSSISILTRADKNKVHEIKENKKHFRAEHVCCYLFHVRYKRKMGVPLIILKVITCWIFFSRLVFFALLPWHVRFSVVVRDKWLIHSYICFCQYCSTFKAVLIKWVDEGRNVYSWFGYMKAWERVSGKRFAEWWSRRLPFRSVSLD